MPVQHVFCSGENAGKVYAVVMIETLVLSINQGFEKHGGYLGIFHRGAVFVEILANQLSVLAIKFRSLGGFGIHDAVYRGRLAEQPKEVQIYRCEVYYHKGKERKYSCNGLVPPWAAFELSFIPMSELFELRFQK